jgi:hypothetical protein
MTRIEQFIAEIELDGMTHDDAVYIADQTLRGGLLRLADALEEFWRAIFETLTFGRLTWPK